MKQVVTGLQVDENVKRRVAGYARVSTDFKEQLTSYAAQVDYFTKYITSREDWQLVEVYTDVDTPYGQNAKSP
jgi:predicted site-specific integrase-resolvase